MVPGVNNRKSGLQLFHDRLKLKAHDGRPMILIFNTCRAFIDTIPVLVSDPKNPEDVNTRQEDHVYDETRYALLSRESRIVVDTGDLSYEKAQKIDEARARAYNPLRDRSRTQVVTGGRSG